ncbi:hypothetical protein [Alloactinosynnema sp. L-07]|uniref:pPIWI_RE_Y domain-containing protein n=1 Tax=Alloactinosynnema sp. L-07 TaxID=1653480 RepID=UPI00065F0170|nr:HU-CCDC81 and SPOR domain-containing protein [Alloactinosynnema sp. L-07]CRK59381.1 hypothetical protein [Alloactinosynnema sp. L-07]
MTEDEHLLGAVASALVAIEELRDLTMFRMPYPPAVQRTVDRFVLHCLRRQALPPRSLPGLVRWGYTRPLGYWPLTLPADLYPEDELLVDDEAGAPTAFCHEVALWADTDNPLREASPRMAEMAGLAAERNQAWAFSTMRGVLAEYPALTNDLFNEVRFAHKLGVLDEWLGGFYDEIGLEHEHDGKVFPCARCRIPLRPITEDSWWCEREECRTGGAVAPGDPLDWDAEVSIQSDRRYRQFVSGPGRAVLRIADALARPGVTTRTWPVHSPGDLRVEVSDGRGWSAFVVDWHSPALLGRAIAVAVARFGADTAVWVVAQYRVDADPEYLRTVREHATAETGPPRVSSEDEFVDMVRRCDKGSGHG